MGRVVAMVGKVMVRATTTEETGSCENLGTLLLEECVYWVQQCFMGQVEV